MSYMQNIPLWKRMDKQDPSFDPKHMEVRESKKLSEKDLYALTKKEQVELIFLYNYKGIIPKYEKDRVKLILKIQK